MVMEHKGSDTKSLNSSASGSANNSNEHLMPLSGAKFGFAINESGAINSEQSTSEVHSL